jgi:hypothetical protein
MGKWILGVLAALYAAGFIGLLAVPENFYAQTGIAWFKPNPEESIARAYVEDVRRRNFASAEAAFDPQYATDAMPAQFAKLASFFPATSPVSIKLVGCHTYYGSDATRYDLTYEYEFPRQWVFADIMLQRMNGKLNIERIHVAPMSMSFERANAFSFAGKSDEQSSFLMVMLFNAAFIFVTGFVCLATPIPKWKWAWLIFVLCGLVTFRLNWTTGAWDWQLLSFVLFGAAATKAPYGPVMLQIGLPIGAATFWMRRDTWLEQAHASAPAATADKFE